MPRTMIGGNRSAAKVGTVGYPEKPGRAGGCLCLDGCMRREGDGFGLAFVIFTTESGERYVVVLPVLDLGAWNAWSDGSAISIRHDHPSPIVDISKNGTLSSLVNAMRRRQDQSSFLFLSIT